VLVFVPPDFRYAPEYFILSSEEMITEMDKLMNAAIAQGKLWSGRGEGINWRQSVSYKDCRFNLISSVTKSKTLQPLSIVLKLKNGANGDLPGLPVSPIFDPPKQC